jgi:hypothetical protein
MRKGVTGDWRKLHNGPHKLYSSPNIIRVIKSRKMRPAGNVSMHTKLQLDNLMGRDQ